MTKVSRINDFFSHLRIKSYKKFSSQKHKLKAKNLHVEIETFFQFIYPIISGIEIRSLTGCCTQKPGQGLVHYQVKNDSHLNPVIRCEDMTSMRQYNHVSLAYPRNLENHIYNTLHISEYNDVPILWTSVAVKISTKLLQSTIVYYSSL